MIESRGSGTLTSHGVEEVIRQVAGSLDLMASSDVPQDRIAQMRTSVEFMQSASTEAILQTLVGAQSLYGELKEAGTDNETISAQIKQMFPHIVHLLPFLRRQTDGMRLAFLLAEGRSNHSTVGFRE
jgi:hypothetical protein